MLDPYLVRHELLSETLDAPPLADVGPAGRQDPLIDVPHLGVAQRDEAAPAGEAPAAPLHRRQVGVLGRRRDQVRILREMQSST